MPKKKRPIFCLLFDLDGTLINSLPDITGVVNQLRKEHALVSMSAAEVKPFIGKGAEHLLQNTLQELLSRYSLEELVFRYRNYSVQSPSFGGEAYPGVEQTLQSCRKQFRAKLGVVTNKPTLAAEASLKTYLPSIAFDIVAGPEKVTARKPDPRHLLEVMSELGASPEHSCFVGDDNIDYECAQRSGVAFWGASYGFGGIKIPESLSLSSFGELKDKMSQLWRGVA